MSNHVHLIAEATTAMGLRHAMHGLNLAYALTYKRRYGHTGHFWQDRFKRLLTPNPLYEHFGASPAQRQTGYRQFVEGQLCAQTPAWMSQAAVGSPDFLEELAGRLGHAMSQRPRGRPRASSLTPVHEK
jgi:hypothetical protein